MQGREDRFRVVAAKVETSFLGDLEVLLDQISGARRADTKDHFRLDETDLAEQPMTASVSFVFGGRAIHGSSGGPIRGAALDGIGDINAISPDSGVDQSFVQELTGPADEGASRLVFGVAGSLTDQHEGRGRIAFAKDDGGSPLRECAFAAIQADEAQFVKRHGPLPPSAYRNCRPGSVGAPARLRSRS